MTKTIIFDLGKVIVPFDFKRAYTAFEAHCGIPAGEIPTRLSTTGLYHRFESGLLEPQEFVAEISRHLGMTLGYEDFCPIWTSIFMPETLLSEKFIADLASRFRLILLSNTNVIHFEMVRASYPILQHFHAFVLSYEVREMKPAPAIFRKALEVAGCAAGECVFIDDIAENVEGARALGIDAIQFHSAEQLQGELAARGLL